MLVAVAICAGGIPAQADGPVLGQEADSGTRISTLPNKKEPKPIAPINMSTGTVFKKGKLATSLKYIYFDKEDLYNGSSNVAGKYNGKYDRWQHTLQLGMRYGLFDDFDVRVMVPFHFRGVSRRSAVGKPAETERDDTNDGLGDIVLMGRYALLSQREGDPFSLAVGAGIKTPTGDSGKTNAEPFNKTYKYMGPGFQLGTGSWDPKFELGATYMFGRSRLDSHFLLTLPTEGDHGLRKGDNFKYNFGYGYALSDLLDLELEINGIYSDQNSNDGAIVKNTGGHTVYLTPGIHFKFGKGLNAGLAVPIVAYRDLNANEDADQYSIGEDFRVVFKLGASF